ncbi:hypothetical protein Gotri_022880 [Gossypium trilobum]|uniref:HAT C-terminal dimerisation domain-containing protein n=1 Tax=Gossypium trilobum TaxID=34281 RepID=A0A7J9DHG9_9ROSI|nr:hypothetical protein [Gossypium trilobum]
MIAHFIDDNWEPKMKILACKTLEHIYDTKALSKIIQGLVLEWNISKKVHFPSNHWLISCTLIEDGFRDMDSNYPTVTLMKRKFDYHRSLCNSAFVVATILDLRLKFKFLELSYTEIHGHDSKMHLKKFHKVFTDVYYEYANEARNLKFASARNFNEVASWKSKLDCYLDGPLLPLDGAFDVLYWWRINTKRFPTLAKMARYLLAMPMLILTPCLNFNAMITNPT